MLWVWARPHTFRLGLIMGRFYVLHQGSNHRSEVTLSLANFYFSIKSLKNKMVYLLQLPFYPSFYASLFFFFCLPFKYIPGWLIRFLSPVRTKVTHRLGFCMCELIICPSELGGFWRQNVIWPLLLWWNGDVRFWNVQRLRISTRVDHLPITSGFGVQKSLDRSFFGEMKRLDRFMTLFRATANRWRRKHHVHDDHCILDIIKVDETPTRVSTQ